jgi:hypothetical protein
MATIECEGEKFLFASDVQGPMDDFALKIILAEKPHLIIIGGPPIYLAGFRVKNEHVEQGMKNLESLAKNIPTTILEHHILREEKWREFSQPVFDVASKSGHSVVTAAEFLTNKNNLLEFRRKQLFEMKPPNSEFDEWMKLPRPKRKLIKPPI